VSGPRVETAPALRAAVEASVRRGCAWLKGLIDRDGQISGSDQASLYFKVPAALMVTGELGAALRNLNWIANNLVGPDGALKTPQGQPEPRSYDRGWLLWSAATCGRYDIAFPLAADLKAFQCAATGGFWDSRKERLENAGTHHAMTVGFAGLGLLAVRHVDEARAAADFLSGLLERQSLPQDRVEVQVHVNAAGEQTLTRSDNPSDFVDCRATRQRPARIGPAQILLIRLYRLSGDPRYLRAAWNYTNMFLDGADGIYDCVESHKFMWGMLELMEVSPDPRLRPAADRVAAYIVSRQQPDGQWLGDAIGGGSKDQSLELRVNTTCNALVGLGYYLHLAADEQVAPTAV